MLSLIPLLPSPSLPLHSLTVHHLQDMEVHCILNASQILLLMSHSMKLNSLNVLMLIPQLHYVWLSLHMISLLITHNHSIPLYILLMNTMKKRKRYFHVLFLMITKRFYLSLISSTHPHLISNTLSTFHSFPLHSLPVDG